jgi:serine/threonine protein kinase
MARSEWIGKKLSNRYVIEELLGQGGMSAVYKAMDPNLKRMVAIKMIHAHLSSDPDFVQRFEEEASGVAQLRHPRIIQVYDFNQDDGAYYMVLEFVPGENLQDHLKRLADDERKLPISKAIEYMIDVCDAVDYAHRRGLIHRDIKPANIMLTVLGEAILMDFGIAKIVGSQRHTATGAVVGTAMYMSPEQIKGERPDQRTDIYSLGVTLFEMVSGRPPFKADSAMTLMMMHINDPVPDPKKLNPDVPDDLVAVIRKALAKSPNERYQSAAEMASALRRVLGRINAGTATGISAPNATMIEASPNPFQGTDATSLEAAPAISDETMVESARPFVPDTRGSDKDITRTGLESSVKAAPPLTPTGTGRESSVKSSPLPAPATSGTRDSFHGTAVESSTVPPIPAPPPAQETAPKRAVFSMPVIAGIAVGLACLLFGGVFLVNSLLSGTTPPTEPPTVLIVESTQTLAPTQEQAVVPLATETIAVTETPAETATPNATPTPDTPYVVITDIRTQGDLYAVDYEVFNFPQDANLHVHIFFDTVPPEQAGSPGAGPWKLTFGAYGNPPFTQYGIASRPADATQMCALVANPNHSVQLNSGNCVDLP